MSVYPAFDVIADIRDLSAACSSVSSFQRKKLQQRLTQRATSAFIRDESSKGRYNASLSRVCLDLQIEIFERVLARDLGPADLSKVEKPKHVC